MARYTYKDVLDMDINDLSRLSDKELDAAYSAVRRPTNIRLHGLDQARTNSGILDRMGNMKVYSELTEAEASLSEAMGIDISPVADPSMGITPRKWEEKIAAPEMKSRSEKIREIDAMKDFLKSEMSHKTVEIKTGKKVIDPKTNKEIDEMRRVNTAQQAAYEGVKNRVEDMKGSETNINEVEKELRKRGGKKTGLYRQMLRKSGDHYTLMDDIEEIIDEQGKGATTENVITALKKKFGIAVDENEEDDTFAEYGVADEERDFKNYM